MGQRLLAYKAALLAASLAAAAVALVYNVEGSHRQTILDAEKYLLWCLWWIGLGVLSSVGLGTGLHTFLLYLVRGGGTWFLFFFFSSSPTHCHVSSSGVRVRTSRR